MHDHRIWQAIIIIGIAIILIAYFKAENASKK